MKREKRIEINAAIFPYIMRIALSKPLTKDSDAEAVDTPSSSLEIPDIMIDLPRGAYLLYLKNLRFLYKGIIIKHNKTEPTYTKTSLFLCEKRRFFMARTEKGVVTTI